MAIFQVDLDYMQSRLDAGDRAAFYLHYYNLTRSNEAALQAQVSSYSGAIGNSALWANQFVQGALTVLGCAIGIPLIQMRFRSTSHGVRWIRSRIESMRVTSSR